MHFLRFGAIVALVFAGLQAAGAQQPALPQGISAQAMAQIDALLADKGQRTAAQQKVDSQLIFAQRIALRRTIAPGVPTLLTGVTVAVDGTVEVDIRAEVNDDLLDRLNVMGVPIIERDYDQSTVRARLSFAQIDRVAELPQVISIEPMAHYETSRMRMADQVASAAGSRASQGDATHLATTARSTYGATGAGVKIGVLSDGVDGLAQSQASADLPAVTVISGQAGSGAEGTAMLEIIHDLAPGAQLFFATGITSKTTFANNIRALRAAGCDIIVDDIGWSGESPFQDGQHSSVVSTTNGGVIAQAVKDVAADGALYFSSAGNAGRLDAGTSGTWEGDFVDGGAYNTTSRIHSFGSQTYNVVTQAGNNLGMELFWADPLGASANDYDLFILNSAGTAVIASSTNSQTGTRDPYERTGAVPAGSRAVIARWSGSARYLRLVTNRGRLSISTSGEVSGHATTTEPNSFAVAATPAGTPYSSSTAAGPYPGAFHSGNQMESFSSDGPRRMFFTNSGGAMTSGNFSSTGGIVLNKPDFAAADGVSVTGNGGFPTTFYGTSAAAPHAAAVAALIKSANPSLTIAQVRTALINSAIDVHAPGFDRNSGFGIVMAGAGAASVACTYAITPASVTVGSVTDIGGVQVTTQAGCPWSAQADTGSSFIGFSNNVGRSGSGVVPFTVQTNFGGPRAGAATIAGKTFSLTQRGYDDTRRRREQARADFNGDGWPDLIWREQTRGYMAAWFMEYGIETRAGTASFDIYVDDLDWRIAGTGDFNADSKPDLLWHHRVNGSLYVWYMDGVRRIGHAGFSPFGIYDPGWRVAGVGDFNGDTKPDIVWQHDTAGWIVVWLLNGTALSSGLETTPDRVDPRLKIVGVADLDGDAKSDLVFRHIETGALNAWFMNGAVRLENVPLQPAVVDDLDWQIDAVVDLNGDTAPDIVWRHRVHGWVSAWYMNGAGRIGYGTFGIPIDLTWSITGPK